MRTILAIQNVPTGTLGAFHGTRLNRQLRKLQGDESCALFTDVGQGVSQAARYPGDVAGFELLTGGGLAWDVTPQIKIAHGYDQMWTGVMMFRQDATRLQFKFGGAHIVLDEEDVLGAAVQDVEAAVFIPCRGRLAQFLVLQKFDGDITEGLIGKIFGDVGEAAGEEPSLAVLQLERDRELSGNIIFYLRRAQGHEDVIVLMAMHQRSFVRGDFYFEDAYVLVLQREMVVRLSGNCDFRSSLRAENESGQKQERNREPGSHEAKF